MNRDSIRVDSQDQQDGDRGRRAVQRWLVALLLTGSIALASVASAEAAPKLLLLPFVVHSSEDPEYVRGGLSDMLNSRFARIGGLELIAEEDPEKGTSKLETALETARDVGADFVLFGSFTRFGKGASLDVQCAPAAEGQQQEPLREIFVHSGSIGEIIPDLDDLAGKVVRFARGEIVNRPPQAAAAPANPSPSTSASAEDFQDLVDRVAALEAVVTELLDQGAGEDSVP